MNLNQLLYFCTVARTGSYSRAADELEVSQAAIYRAVKRLEKSSGVKLFEKAGMHVSLTEIGRSLYECGSQLAHLNNEAEAIISDEKELLVGKVSIGAGTPIASYALPDIFAKWLSDHPRLTASLIVGVTSELQRLLTAGQLDVILAPGSRWAHGLRRELVYSDSLVVVCATNHPLIRSTPIRLQELDGERLIAPFRDSAIREEIDQIQHDYGVQLKVSLEVNRQDTIKRLCRAGVGIGVLPKSVVVEELSSNQLGLLNVEGFPRHWPYFLMYRPGKVLTPGLKSIISAVRLWAEGQAA
ncbi:MAG: LysR family transcriptional regulator [Chloroflexi bacterium]|nr:LysR family transcriptional regulator [Chloroflexota bacterium]